MPGSRDRYRRLGSVLVGALLLLAPGRATAGELVDITVAQALDPVGGVRMIEVVGTDAGADGEVRTLWLMISDAHFARLLRCAAARGPRESGPGLQFSDRSRMVMVVVCT
jgi:hypothetical protein